MICGIPYGITKCGATAPEQTDCASSANGGTCVFYEEVINGVTYLVPKCSIAGQTYNFYMGDFTTDYPASIDTGAFLKVPCSHRRKVCMVTVTCGTNCSWDFVNVPKCGDGTFGATSGISYVKVIEGTCDDLDP